MGLCGTSNPELIIMTTEDRLQLRDRGEMSKVQFKNDERTHEFLITIARKGNLDTIQTNPDTDLDTSPQRRKYSILQRSKKC